MDPQPLSQNLALSHPKTKACRCRRHKSSTFYYLSPLPLIGYFSPDNDPSHFCDRDADLFLCRVDEDIKPPQVLIS